MGRKQTGKRAHAEGKRRWTGALALIPIVLILYVIYANAKPFGGSAEFTNNVGGEDTTGEFRLTGPMDRISEKKIDNSEYGRTGKIVDYRELKSSLVYFEYSGKMSDRAKIGVEARFKDNFPFGGIFKIGAKNGENFSFEWKEVYNPVFEKLNDKGKAAEFGNVRIYGPKGKEGNYSSVEEWIFENVPAGSKIGTYKYKVSPYLQGTVGAGSTKINTTLRGGHTLYTYAENGKLTISVEKQDMNWYNGTDDLGIFVYSMDGKLAGNKTIWDDGVINASGKAGKIQKATLALTGLKKEPYRIELKAGSDLYIKGIEIDQKKVVFKDQVFIIDPARVYTTGGRVDVQTYHKEGLQNVSIGNKSVRVNETGKWFGLDAGEGEIGVPKGDMIIKTDGYLSFTKEAYFLPQRYTVEELKDFNGTGYIVANVDFGNYSFARKDGEWRVASAEWDAADLWIKDNKLQIVASPSHLGDKKYENYTIPLDYLKITIREPAKWN